MVSRTLLVLALVACNKSGEDTSAAGPAGDPLPTVLTDAQRGDPKIDSADSIAFAPAGHLVIGDGANDRLVVVATADTAADPTAADWDRISNLQARVADALGADEADVRIEDIAVNPLSGRTYVAASRMDTDYAGIFTVAADKTLEVFDMSDVDYVRVPYPEVGGAGSVVTDVVSTDNWIVASATEPGFTPSQVLTVPIPIAQGDDAGVTSTNTYHRSHQQWETFAPITTLFALTDDDGQDWVGASYQCAPVVRFPIEDLAAGDAETVGTTPYDYGPGRQVTDFAVIGSGSDTQVLAAVSGLGGTMVDRKLFLTKKAEELDETSPIVFGFDRTPAHDQADAAAKLDDTVAMAVQDADRIVRLQDSGELEVVANPQ